MTTSSAANNSQRQFILTGSMFNVAWRLSWPAVLAMVLYGFNAVLDAIFVGRYVGETALAGVSLAYPISSLSLGVGSLIGVGAGSLLSIAIGAKNEQTQRALLGNVNALNLACGLGFTLLALLLSERLIRMMGGQGEALLSGEEYLRHTFYVAVLWIAGLSYNMIVRAEGKMKTAALIMSIGLVVNLIANYLFIVVMNWGVVGAAWGTNLGMLVYVLSFMIYAKSKHITFAAKPFSLSWDTSLIKSIFSMGFAAFIMSVMSLIQAIVVFNAISAYGSDFDVAFYGVAFRLFTFLLTPIFGLMRALQPAVGINFGAGEYERVIQAVKVFALLATLLMMPFWLFAMWQPALLLGWMMPEATFLAQHIVNFRIFMVLLPALPLIFMAMTFFPAINQSKVASVIGIARQLVFYVPAMLILPRVFGIDWVYYASFLIDAVIIVWMIWALNREFGRLRRGEVSMPVKSGEALATGD